MQERKSYAHNRVFQNVKKSVAQEITDKCVDQGYNIIKPTLNNNLFFRESLHSAGWLIVLAEVQDYNENARCRSLYFCWHGYVKGVKRNNLYLI